MYAYASQKDNQDIIDTLGAHKKPSKALQQSNSSIDRDFLNEPR